jgi:hypothetical protein
LQHYGFFADRAQQCPGTNPDLRAAHSVSAGLIPNYTRDVWARVRKFIEFRGVIVIYAGTRKLTERRKAGEEEVMPNRVKRPSALKHGVFSEAPILPGEDPQEFRQILDDVVEEWHPSGPTEQDAVDTIAKGIWLKRRAGRFREVQSLKSSVDPNHPAYDESFGLITFAAFMRVQPETALGEYASRCLRPDKIKNCKKNFHAANSNQSQNGLRLS